MAREAEHQTETRQRARSCFRRAYRALQRGRTKTAIRLYQESIAIHPTAEAYTFLGWAHSFRREYVPAIDCCHRAIELDPDFGNPYNDIGAYLIELDRWEEAEPWLEAATRMRRSYSYYLAHFNLGRLCQRRHEFARAEHHFAIVVRMEPRHEPARRALALLRARRN